MANISDLLGIGQFAKIKLGKGVAGKLIHALMLFMTVVGVIAVFSGNIYLQAGIVILIVFVFVYAIHRIIRFTEQHPLPAVLEGAELVKIKQIEIVSRGRESAVLEANVAPPTEISFTAGPKPQGQSDE